MNHINNIFDLFKSDDKPEDNQIIVDYTQYPPYWILMFKKLILNQLVSYDEVLFRAKIIRPDLKKSSLKERIKNAYYPYAFEFLEKIDLNKKEHQEYVIEYTDENFYEALKSSLNYFENIEAYEKCVQIKTIQDLVSNNLAKKYS